jgi:hypothetical protein
MNAHTADHDRPVDNRDAFARFCRCDCASLARWATTYYDKIVFGSVVDRHSVWFAHWISPMLATLLSLRASSFQFAAQLP